MKRLDLPILHEIRALRELMGQWDQHCETIESPYDIFDRKLAVLHELAQSQIRELAQNQSMSVQDSSQEAEVDKIMKLGMQKGELIRNHNVTIASDEAAYVQAFELHRFRLVKQLIDIVGMNVLGAVLSETPFQLIRRSELLNNPAQRAGEPTPEQDPLPSETRESEERVQPHDDPRPEDEVLSDEALILDEAMPSDEAMILEEAVQSDEVVAPERAAISEQAATLEKTAAPEKPIAPAEAMQPEETTHPEETTEPDENTRSEENLQPQQTTQPAQDSELQETTPPIAEPSSKEVDAQARNTDGQQSLPTPSDPVSRPDDSIERLTVPQPPEPSEPNPSPVHTSPKKRTRPTDDRPHRQAKRVRISEPEPSVPSSERVIEFKDVFQGGKARMKYTIASHQGEWYILRCEEHDLTFGKEGKNPIYGAAKHLGSKAHDGMRKDHQLAIDTLGTRVLRCNAATAERNNQVTMEAFSKGYDYPKKGARVKKPRGSLREESPAFYPHWSLRTQEESNARQSDRRTRGAFSGIIDPVPGEVYFGFYNQWHAVLVLPTIHVEGAVYRDLPGRIEDKDIGLIDDLPECYDLDPQTGHLRWHAGYEDGGPSVTKRRFPVVFFGGLDFTRKSSAAWLPANDINAFDQNGEIFKMYAHRKPILKYLETRAARLARISEAEDSRRMDPAEVPAEPSMMDLGADSERVEQPSQTQDEQPTSHAPATTQSDSQADGDTMFDANVRPSPETPDAVQERASHPPPTTQNDRQEAGDGVLAKNVASTPSVPTSDQGGPPQPPGFAQRDGQGDDEVFHENILSSLSAPDVAQEEASHPPLIAECDTQEASDRGLTENVPTSCPVPAVDRDETSHPPSMAQCNKEAGDGELTEDFPLSSHVSTMDQDETSLLHEISQSDRQADEEGVREENTPSPLSNPDTAEEDASSLPIVAPIGGPKADDGVPKENVPSSPLIPQVDQEELFHPPVSTHSDLQADGTSCLENNASSSLPIAVVTQTDRQDADDRVLEDPVPSSTRQPALVQNDRQVGDERVAVDKVASSPLIPDVVPEEPIPDNSAHEELIPDGPVHDGTEEKPQSTGGPLDSPVDNVHLDFEKAHQATNREVSEATSFEERFRALVSADIFDTDDDPYRTIIRENRPPSIVSISSDDTDSSGPSLHNSPLKQSAEPQQRVQIAPFAPMHDEQKIAQTPIAEKDNLTQTTVDTLQKDSFLPENRDPRVKEGARLAEIASNSLRRCSVAMEEPIKPPPFRTVPLTAPFITSDDCPPAKKPPRSYTVPRQAVVGRVGETPTRPGTTGRVQSQAYESPYSVPGQKSLKHQHAALQRQNNRSRQPAPMGQPLTFLSPLTPAIVFPSPKDLQANAAPTTNQLPPFNLRPPDHSIPQSASPAQVGNMASGMSHQQQLPRFQPRPAPNHQLPLPHTPIGSNRQAGSLYEYTATLNTQARHAPGEFPIQYSLNPEQRQVHNAQAPRGLSHNNTNVQGPVGYSCPYCSAMYGEERRRDEHVRRDHK